MHEMGHLLGYGHAAGGLMAPVLAAGPLPRSSPGSRLSTLDSGLWTVGSSAEAVEPLGQAEWRIGLDDVFADLTLDGSEDATLSRVPRRSRLQRYEREVDDWFADIAEEAGR
jgi:hypothetical protein